ncbi:hypothetical protein EVAR_30941_1 [Eumeta japonica]|uniref:Uncharacterized protein n=1 Tax=Eumeta variegata TaxID=151549 RepID=A0A4C1V3J4_EUMVA|nr:hypothetical protein EVAR_30941_1 [Eumeta japonica]
MPSQLLHATYSGAVHAVRYRVLRVRKIVAMSDKSSLLANIGKNVAVSILELEDGRVDSRNIIGGFVRPNKRKNGALLGSLVFLSCRLRAQLAADLLDR